MVACPVGATHRSEEKGRVSALRHRRIKETSITGAGPSGNRKETANGRHVGRIIVVVVAAATNRSPERVAPMVDLTYALVFTGAFLVLALTLRGLERL